MVTSQEEDSPFNLRLSGFTKFVAANILGKGPLI